MTEFFRKLNRIPPVMIDGALYAALATFIPIHGMLSTDEAAKYVEAETLWWIRLSMAGVLGGLGGLKMFRSTSYSEHLHEKANGVKVVTETK